jgi:hypothetical protein
VYATGNLNNVLRPQNVVPRAALRIEKLHQFLKRFRVRRVPQKSALTSHLHQIFILQFVQMVGKCGFRGMVINDSERS